MPTFAYRRPRLASHYYVRSEPPDERGDEALHFISETRRIKVKGHSFREFQQRVVPLLDGKHTVEQITAAVADVFAPPDVVAGLSLLAEQHLLEDADVGPAGAPGDARRPQLNLLHDLGVDPLAVQQRLQQATVAVVGLGGAGAGAALGLAAAGVGTLRLIDPNSIHAADPYLATAFAADDLGSSRAAVVGRRVASLAPQAATVTCSGPLDDDAQVHEAVAGSDFVVCAVDMGQSSLIYRLNRVCLRAGLRFMAVTPAAFEISVGPLVQPFETACYMCYRMRIVACAEEPEDEFAFQSLLDRRKRDDSAARENLVFGTSLAGQLAGLEAFKALSGVVAPATRGAVVVLDLLTLSTTKHVVLRKPWCPACHGGPGALRAEPAPGQPA